MFRVMKNQSNVFNQNNVDGVNLVKYLLIQHPLLFSKRKNK